MDFIKFENKEWIVPENPKIGFIIGDGIGIDVTPVAIKVINAAVSKAYGESKKIIWKEILLGEKAEEQGKSNFSQEALDEIKKIRIVLKGPLTTPVGSGFRSLNVALRQKLDLYACIRPINYIPGVPSPMKHPEKLNVVIFRENTEDVYAGIEWKSGSDEIKKVIKFLEEKMEIKIYPNSGIGLKPISKDRSQRLVTAAINYAIKNNKKSVTFVHKGNIMKFTEGAFKNWAYEIAEEKFKEKIVLEGEEIEGNKKVVLKDRIADAMFQQLLLRPEEYDVIATTNLNGDYLSDACAAQVGGLGLAPGANINLKTGLAVFEATHGSAPKYAGLDKVNPSSVILSGVMMLELMSWKKAANLITESIKKTISLKTVTYDLARQMEGAKLLKCSEFGENIIKNFDLESVHP